MSSAKSENLYLPTRKHTKLTIYITLEVDENTFKVTELPLIKGVHDSRNIKNTLFVECITSDIAASSVRHERYDVCAGSYKVTKR